MDAYLPKRLEFQVLRFGFLLAGVVFFEVTVRAYEPKSVAKTCSLLLANSVSQNFKILNEREYSKFEAVPMVANAPYHNDGIAIARQICDPGTGEVDYINAENLGEILYFAFENAAGHGYGASVSPVAWGREVTDKGVRIWVVNDRYRELPPTIKNRVFKSNENATEVPDTERDLERGGFGMGVKAMTGSFRLIYKSELQTDQVATMQWHEAVDPNDKRHPEKTLLEIHVPVPEPAALGRLQTAKDLEKNEQVAKKKRHDEAYAAIDVLKKAGEGKFKGTDAELEKAISLVIENVREGLRKNSTDDPLFSSSIFALGDAGLVAHRAKEMLLDIFDNGEFKYGDGERWDFRDAVADALFKVGATSPDDLKLYVARAKTFVESNDLRGLLALSKLFKEMRSAAADAKPILIECMSIATENQSHYKLFNTIEAIGLNASDAPYLIKAFRSFKLQGEESELYYFSKLIRSVDGRLFRSLKPDLIKLLNVEHSSYYAAGLLKHIGVTNADKAAIKKLHLDLESYHLQQVLELPSIPEA